MPIRKFYIDGDLSGGYRFGGDYGGTVARVRIQPGVELGEHFALQTGIVFEGQSFFSPSTRIDRDGDVTFAEVANTVGWTVGVRF